MRDDIGGKSVKKGLCPALVKTLKKCHILFFVPILFLSFANIARAEAVPDPNKQNSKTITVRASVSLTPEFIYSIKKNSSIKLTKAAFALGEEVRVQVKVVAGNNFPLRGHKINLQILNKQNESLFILSGETDNDGLAHFSFLANENLFGKHTLRIVDVTYGGDIVISKELVFIVYKPSDGQMEKELAKQKIIVRKPAAPERILFDETQEFSPNDGILQNSGTIIAYAEIQSPNKWSNDP